MRHAWIRLVLVGACLGCLLVEESQGAGCLFRWRPVTEYTQESCPGAQAGPAASSESCKVKGKVQYRIWYQGSQDAVPQAIATTDATRIQVRSCNVGSYFLTAYQGDPQVEESELSEPLTQVQLKAPQERTSPK
jgi:hypothetical protein